MEKVIAEMGGGLSSGVSCVFVYPTQWLASAGLVLGCIGGTTK